MIVPPSLLDIDPPLLNTASRWATTEAELTELYNCTSTGAITVRTSLLQGFNDDPAIHQYCFFDGSSKSPSSLNTIGYSPITLPEYIDIIHKITISSTNHKPVIFSVTGSAAEVAKCVDLLASSSCRSYAAAELNLSCPNIPGKPPPAYSSVALKEYLVALPKTPKIPIGLKLPPYTYHDQFAELVEALKDPDVCPISFLTSVNTLGTSLVLDEDDLVPILHSATGMGIGGMAGAALHPLALGNVKTLRIMLDEASLQRIKIIGVGGVSDRAGFQRMRKVGAWAVGVATALGVQGVEVFAKIQRG